jgi:hypothetical protein
MDDYVSCRARVWDNGDMTDCGAEALRAERCAEHIASEVRNLHAEIKEHEAEIRKCRKRIGELSTESGVITRKARS